jgi:hypothetical protein
MEFDEDSSSKMEFDEDSDETPRLIKDAEDFDVKPPPVPDAIPGINSSNVLSTMQAMPSFTIRSSAVWNAGIDWDNN